MKFLEINHWPSLEVSRRIWIAWSPYGYNGVLFGGPRVKRTSSPASPAAEGLQHRPGDAKLRMHKIDRQKNDLLTLSEASDIIGTLQAGAQA